ncbi:MAG: hypothetical protein J5482_02805 [Oscillospiraceae bacterium]|nr:hypothetical protein [Oscillospiraceae bacterium]
MVLVSIQKVAMAAVAAQQGRPDQGPYAALRITAAGILRKICEQEPESAERILQRVTADMPLRRAVRETAKRGAAGVTQYEIEGTLRELYGLNEKETDEGGDET